MPGNAYNPSSYDSTFARMEEKMDTTNSKLDKLASFMEKHEVRIDALESWKAENGAASKESSKWSTSLIALASGVVSSIVTVIAEKFAGGAK